MGGRHGEALRVRAAAPHTLSSTSASPPSHAPSPPPPFYFYFSFNDPPPTQIYPLSLHDALPISYDAASQAAVLSGPLLPGTTYDATVLTGIQDAGGTPLPAAHAWSFTTRTWQPVAVDQTGTVGRYSSLVVDGSGHVHVSYLDDTNGELKYAICPASCTTAAGWQTVTVDQGGGACNSIAVDGTGGVHVSYQYGTERKQASCAVNC